MSLDSTNLWNPAEVQKRMEEQMRANAARPLFTGVAVSVDFFAPVNSILQQNKHEAPEVLPHVYTSHSIVGVGGGVLSQFGSKYMLPVGTTRLAYEVSSCLFDYVTTALHESKEYEEVIVPPARTVPPRETERPILISELESIAKGSFPVSRML